VRTFRTLLESVQKNFESELPNKKLAMSRWLSRAVTGTDEVGDPVRANPSLLLVML
jgi:hypothetical protein